MEAVKAKCLGIRFSFSGGQIQDIFLKIILAGEREAEASVGEYFKRNLRKITGKNKKALAETLPAEVNVVVLTTKVLVAPINLGDWLEAAMKKQRASSFPFSLMRKVVAWFNSTRTIPNNA